MRSCIAGVALFVAFLPACATRTGSAPAPGTGMNAPAQTRFTPENLEELMRRIGPAYEALLEQLQANDTAESATKARELAEWFGGVEKFWTQQQRADAVTWAGLARTHASQAAGAAAAGNAERAETEARAMAAACKQCHGTYREPDGAGGYRIKTTPTRPS